MSGRDDQTFTEIFEVLRDALILKDKEPQNVKCEFQGEFRMIQLLRPVKYEELLFKVRHFYNNIDAEVCHALHRGTSEPGSMTAIGNQADLDRAVQQEGRAGKGAADCLHIKLIPRGRGAATSAERRRGAAQPASGSRASGGATGGPGEAAARAGGAGGAGGSVDRESPPPGTLPASDGIFIPDNEELDVLSGGGGGSSRSSSLSSLDSSYYSAHSMMSSGSPTVLGLSSAAGGAERGRGGTFPLGRGGGREGAAGGADGTTIAGKAPPHTYPRHGRRPLLPQSGSFGSLSAGDSTGSSDWSPVSGASRSSGSSASAGSAGLQHKSPRRSPAQWRLGRKLGAGVFGQVYLCLDCETGREMAVKQIHIEGATDDAFKEIRALQCEIQLLKGLSHERIVQYYGSSEDSRVLSIFMEYISAGSVKDHIREHGPLTERVASKYTGQVLQGLAYLHHLMIVHRNIKGANILRDHVGNVKLTEFGLSKRLQTISLTVSRAARPPLPRGGAPVGPPPPPTNHYLAPEVPSKGYGRKADIWSLGCTLVEMLTGSPPWREPSPPAADGPPPRPIYRLPEAVGPPAQAFLGACFCPEPNDRPSANTLLQHQFVATWG